MPAITRIELRLLTGDRENAGTDGDVFLGIAGREYNVDSQGDVNDFERASDRTYIFGEGATVLRPEENDPRSPWQTDANDLAKVPMYIRFEPGPGGDWNLEQADILVTFDGPPGQPPQLIRFSLDPPTPEFPAGWSRFEEGCGVLWA